MTTYEQGLEEKIEDLETHCEALEAEIEELSCHNDSYEMLCIEMLEQMVILKADVHTGQTPWQTLARVSGFLTIYIDRLSNQLPEDEDDE